MSFQSKLMICWICCIWSCKSAPLRLEIAGAPGQPEILVGDSQAHSYSYQLVWAVTSSYLPLTHQVNYWQLVSSLRQTSYCICRAFRLVVFLETRPHWNVSRKYFSLESKGGHIESEQPRTRKSFLVWPSLVLGTIKWSFMYLFHILKHKDIMGKF